MDQVRLKFESISDKFPCESRNTMFQGSRSVMLLGFTNVFNIAAVTLKMIHSGLSLSRTRKRPTNLFEIEKVRDRENYRKYRNFY